MACEFLYSRLLKAANGRVQAQAGTSTGLVERAGDVVAGGLEDRPDPACRMHAVSGAFAVWHHGPGRRIREGIALPELAPVYISRSRLASIQASISSELWNRTGCSSSVGGSIARITASKSASVTSRRDGLMRFACQR